MMVLIFGTWVACASIPSKQYFPKEKVKDIVVGQTTQKEIFDTFGMPVYYGARSQEEPWWMYIHTLDDNSESLSVYFDKEGKVQDVVYTPFEVSLEEKRIVNRR